MTSGDSPCGKSSSVVTFVFVNSLTLGRRRVLYIELAAILTSRENIHRVIMLTYSIYSLYSIVLERGTVRSGTQLRGSVGGPPLESAVRFGRFSGYPVESYVHVFSRDRPLL